MRGSGYAIGEILIFLAVASVIGFLIGWVVFYRRPGSQEGLSPANPNHVRQLENRAQAAETKINRLEIRARAMLDSLQKASRQTGTPGAAATAIAPAAAAPPAAGVAPAADDSETRVITIDETPADPEAEVGQTADAEEPAAGAGPDDSTDADGAPGEAVDEDQGAGEEDEAVVAEQKAPDADTPESDAEESADEYLADADDRIARLEQTLDQLSEKLKELDTD